MNSIRKWAGHCNMLLSATVSECCSAFIFSVKVCCPKAQVDRQVALLDVEASSLLNEMLYFLRVDLM